MSLKSPNSKGTFSCSAPSVPAFFWLLSTPIVGGLGGDLPKEAAHLKSELGWVGVADEARPGGGKKGVCGEMDEAEDPGLVVERPGGEVWRAEVASGLIGMGEVMKSVLGGGWK